MTKNTINRVKKTTDKLEEDTCNTYHIAQYY